MQHPGKERYTIQLYHRRHVKLKGKKMKVHDFRICFIEYKHLLECQFFLKNVNIFNLSLIPRYYILNTFEHTSACTASCIISPNDSMQI